MLAFPDRRTGRGHKELAHGGSSTWGGVASGCRRAPALRPAGLDGRCTMRTPTMTTTHHRLCLHA